MDSSLMNPEALTFPEFDPVLLAAGVYDELDDLRLSSSVDGSFHHRHADPSDATAEQTGTSASNAQNPNVDPLLSGNIINTSYHHQSSSTTAKSFADAGVTPLPPVIRSSSSYQIKDQSDYTASTMATAALVNFAAIALLNLASSQTDSKCAVSGFSSFNNYTFPQHSDGQDAFEEQQQSPYDQHPAPQDQYMRQRASTPQEQQQQYGAQQYGSQQYGQPSQATNNPISYSVGYLQNTLGSTPFADETNSFKTPNYTQPAQNQGSLSVNVNVPQGQTQTPVGFRSQSSIDANVWAKGPNSKPGHPNPKYGILPLDASTYTRPSSHDPSVSPTTPGELPQSSVPSENLGPTGQKWMVPKRAKPGRKAIPRTEEEAKLTRRAQNASAQAKSRDRRQVREEELKKEVQEKVNEIRTKDGELYTLRVANDRLQAEVQRLQADVQMLQQQLAQTPRNDSAFQGY
ncbi:hypothetical protein LTR95_007606 [Oleoguttula sp. CCFEE 5521]